MGFDEIIDAKEEQNYASFGIGILILIGPSLASRVSLNPRPMPSWFLLGWPAAAGRCSGVVRHGNLRPIAFITEPGLASVQGG